MRYKCIVFRPTSPQEAVEFLETQFNRGFKFISCDGGYYYFEDMRSAIAKGF